MEYDSAIRRNGIITQTTTWINPEDGKVRAINKPVTEGHILNDSTHTGSSEDQIHRDRKGNDGCRGLVGGRSRVNVSWVHSVSSAR